MKARNKMSSSARRAPKLMFAAAALALTACQPSLTEWTESESPKVIDVQRLSASLSVPVAGTTLDPQQANQVDSFLSRQGNLFNLRVSLAADNPGNRDAVAQFLVSRGVRPSHISQASTAVSSAGMVDIVAEHYVSAPPSCPDWSRANILDNSNANSSNFGCATASNLARMVADPRDLVVGKSLAPASGTAAAAAVGRYNAGEVKELPMFSFSTTTE